MHPYQLRSSSSVHSSIHSSSENPNIPVDDSLSTADTSDTDSSDSYQSTVISQDLSFNENMDAGDQLQQRCCQQQNVLPFLPPKFSGSESPTQAETWLSQLNFAVNGKQPQQQIQIFVNSLTGTAATWLWSSGLMANPANLPDWNLLLQQFRQRFCQRDFSMFSDMINHKYLINQNIDSYVDEKLKMMEYVNIPVDQYMNCLTSGIDHVELRSMMTSENPAHVFQWKLSQTFRICHPFSSHYSPYAKPKAISQLQSALYIFFY